MVLGAKRLRGSDLGGGGGTKRPRVKIEAKRLEEKQLGGGGDDLVGNVLCYQRILFNPLWVCHWVFSFRLHFIFHPVHSIQGIECKRQFIY